MERLPFPTGHMPEPGRLINPATFGYPTHANACHCDKPVVDAATDQCFRCGRYPQRVIARTWRNRAQVIAERAARRLAA